jgi:serine-aspartate repeat-containing protein C/D/E
LDDGDQWARFGDETDVPVVGDFNGDGIDDLGVYRNGTWYLDSDGNRRLDAHERVIEFGGPDGQPLVGKFDGDGSVRLAIARRQSGVIFLQP